MQIIGLVATIICFDKVYSEAVTLGAFILLVLSVSLGVTASCFVIYYAAKQKSSPDQQRVAIKTLSKISKLNNK
jgi:hypothetical protein